MTVAKLAVGDKNIFEVKRKKRISRRTRIRTFDKSLVHPIFIPYGDCKNCQKRI